MTEKELCRISHYLFVLDTYLFGQPDREDQRQEIEELQKSISRELARVKESEAQT